MNRRVGYRFHPTEEELIDYFLRQKINGTLRCDDIVLIDICQFEPWDLPKHAAQGSNDDEWYFFHKRVPINRNANKPRYNRSTKTGHWKPTGQVRRVKAKHNRMEIGEKKTLVFYKYAEGKKEIRTNWVIHEYEHKAFAFHQANLVLCKLKEKADDKAESSTCREVESSLRGPSDSEVDQQQLLQAMFPDNSANFDQPMTWQQQIQIDEGISIDDLELPDDIFNGSNGLRYQFGTTELQSDTNEMDISFLGVDDGLNAENYLSAFTADPFGYNLEDEAALNEHNLLEHSNSGQSPSGIYLEDISDMDANDFYGLSSHFGDSNLNNRQSGQYRQMQSVQSLTETLPVPKSEVQTCYESLHLPSRYGRSAVTKNLDRHEKINSTGKSNSGSPILVQTHAGSNKNKVGVSMAAGTSKFQFRSSGLSESKERETRKPATNLYLPFKPPKEKVPIKAEKDQKMVTAKTILESTSRKDKTSSYISTENSMLYQRSVPVSVYIINVSIGLVLFVAAVRDLLILH